MAETLTRGEAQVVINDLNKELERVKIAIKNGGILGGSITILENKKVLIQDKLDDLLKKGGLITEEDYNESYYIIKAKEQKELDDLRKKAKTHLFIYIGIAILAITTLFYIKKNEK